MKVQKDAKWSNTTQNIGMCLFRTHNIRLNSNLRLAINTHPCLKAHNHSHRPASCLLILWFTDTILIRTCIKWCRRPIRLIINLCKNIWGLLRVFLRVKTSHKLTASGLSRLTNRFQILLKTKQGTHSHSTRTPDMVATRLIKLRFLGAKILTQSLSKLLSHKILARQMTMVKNQKTRTIKTKLSSQVQTWATKIYSRKSSHWKQFWKKIQSCINKS